MKLVSDNPNNTTDDGEGPADRESNVKLSPNVTLSDLVSDRSDFIIPASDEKGHSVPLSFRCSQAYSRRVAVAVNCPKFPYKTRGDLLRHALHRHLEFLDEIEPELDVDISGLDAVNEIINAENERIGFAKSFDNLSRSVQELSARGSQGQAKKLVLKVLRKVENMTPGYWKDSYLQDLKSRFGHLLPKE